MPLLGIGRYFNIPAAIAGNKVSAPGDAQLMQGLEVLVWQPLIARYIARSPNEARP
jgi:hypothetical protein